MLHGPETCHPHHQRSLLRLTVWCEGGKPAVDQSTAGSLQTPPSAPPAPQEKSSVATGGDDEEFTFESVVALYGQEIPNEIDNLQVIKLDPTVDRALLREQTKTLRELLSYVFDAKIQSWVHTSTR